MAVAPELTQKRKDGRMATLSNVHTERIFEDELCDHLTTHGWSERFHIDAAKAAQRGASLANGYSREFALLPDDLLTFIQETQPEEWAKFKKTHNGQSEPVFLKRVSEQLNRHGMLHVLRHGFKDSGSGGTSKFFFCQFRPANKKNPQLWDWYGRNRLTVVRQLHYSLHNEKSIDLVLFINGLPVATAELKTDLTQNIKDAIEQYKKDRLPRDAKTREFEPLLTFKQRCLVHFAVSTDVVFMTTKLDGENTYFLPFNLGRPDGMGGAGAGNPSADAEHGYPTWYLWHIVWNRDVWLDILGNFLHLETKEVELPDGKKQTREALIFPRFHQLDAVLQLVQAADTDGVGKSYLIQHSAGSGKSNSIAWTAHRLAKLHHDNDEKVFDSVIVITDRRVLDKQLQETVSQFEHKAGVVQNIDRNSQQLADALNQGTPIVVTTLQKFPFILEKVKDMKGRTFALIVDEAHSSQTGSAAQKVRSALSAETKKHTVSVELDGEPVEVEAEVEIDPEDVTAEDIINEVVRSRKRPENVSYFAFTATPKAKTLELFGRVGPDGLPAPFHVYSMRQAIEEGFILDVLKNYTSYRAFYKLASAADEKLVPQSKAKKAIARFAVLHPYNISQKVVVIVEHFRTHVAAKIGGKAKAMVVTDSRKAAVRYKLAVDRYLKERGYDKEMQALVAFSGKVSDPETGPDEFSEANMNPQLKGQEPSDAFKEDAYRLLLVANKYQTGFDQPVLHTMYVDKRLSGVLAVQTLSRLNRTFPGKDDTFVLDFVNEPKEMLESFQPYYRSAQLEGVTDPNIVHELQTKLDQAGVYLASEVDQFAQAFFDPKRKQGSLHFYLKPAKDRFDALAEDAAEQFRKDLGTYLRTYDFLSQVIPYEDPELEKLYAFGKNLMPRIIERGGSSLLDLDADVSLTHYRLQKLGEQKLDLASGETTKLAPVSEAGSGRALTDEQRRLAEVVETMNDLFAGELTEADLVGYVTTIQGKLMENETLAEQAANNSEQQFAMGDFKDILTDIIIEGQEGHNTIADQLLKDDRIFSAMQGMLAKMVFQAFAAQRKH